MHTLADCLRKHAYEHADIPAYTFLADGESQEQVITFSALHRRAEAIAAYLQENKWQGQRAVLFFPFGLEFIIAFMGCLYAGVIPIAIYPPRLNRQDHTSLHVFKDADPIGILTSCMFADKLRNVLSPDSVYFQVPWITVDSIRGEYAQRFHPATVNADDIAFIQYTSGSTSRPKGVVITHANIMNNTEALGKVASNNPSTIALSWLPLYHDKGLIWGFMHGVYVGYRTVLFSPFHFVQKPYRWLKAITTYRATISGGPNFAYEICLQRITPEQRDTLDLSSWSIASNGAEVVRPQTLERFADYFAPCGLRKSALFPCYGMAETTLIATGGPVNRMPVYQKLNAKEKEHFFSERVSKEKQFVSCGRPAGQEVIIVDPYKNILLKEKQTGEIWIAGPSVARGYWRADSDEQERFHARYIGQRNTKDYFRTGDLGFLAEGELYVVGRLKELIIKEGRNHSPLDIELTAQACEAAFVAGGGAAFSIEQEEVEEIVLIQEIVHNRFAGDYARLADKVRQAIAREHGITLVAMLFVKPRAVPKTTSGKTQRLACKERFLSDRFETLFHWEKNQGKRLSKTSTS